MFDVIASSILSITFKILLYLNLPPNLLMSVDEPYVNSPFVIFVFNSETVVTLDGS